MNLASPAVTRARPAAAAPKCKSIKEIQEEELEKKDIVSVSLHHSD